jgi:hypothetical protein
MLVCDNIVPVGNTFVCSFLYFSIFKEFCYKKYNVFRAKYRTKKDFVEAS